MRTYLVHFYYNSGVPRFSHAVEAEDALAAQLTALLEFDRLGLAKGVTKLTTMEI